MQDFYKQRQAEIGKKNKANAQQLFASENYWHSASTLSSTNNRTYSKKKAKEQACLYSCDYAINLNENEDKNENRFT